MSYNNAFGSQSIGNLAPAGAWYAIGPLVGLISSLLLALSVGCGPPVSPYETLPSRIEELATRKDSRDPLVQSQSRGRRVYHHYCQICHGEQGGGDGFNSTNLSVRPRNFADEQFWKTASDKSLMRAISDGGESVGRSRLMPAWGRTLDEQQIRDVIAFLKTIPALGTTEAAPASAGQ